MADWDSSASYDAGVIISWNNRFWRSTRPVKGSLFAMFAKGDVPGQSNAWLDLGPAPTIVRGAIPGSIRQSPIAATVASPSVTRSPLTSPVATRVPMATVPSLAVRSPLTRPQALSSGNIAATMRSPLTQKASQADKGKLNAAAAHAQNTAKKLARFLPRASSKLQSSATKATQKATQIKGVAADTGGHEAPAGGIPTGMTPEALATEFFMVQQDLAALTAALEALATLGDTADWVYSTMVQYPATQQSGQAFLNQVDSFMASNDPDDSMTNRGIPSQAAALNSQGQSWLSQNSAGSTAAAAAAAANAAQAAADYGSSGGGGGGDSGDSGMSAAAAPEDEEEFPAMEDPLADRDEGASINDGYSYDDNSGLGEADARYSVDSESEDFQATTDPFLSNEDEDSSFSAREEVSGEHIPSVDEFWFQNPQWTNLSTTYKPRGVAGRTYTPGAGAASGLSSAQQRLSDIQSQQASFQQGYNPLATSGMPVAQNRGLFAAALANAQNPQLQQYDSSDDDSMFGIHKGATMSNFLDEIFGVPGVTFQRRPVPPRAGFKPVQTPHGTTRTALVTTKQKSTPSGNAATVANARAAGQRAVATAGKLQAALSKSTSIHGVTGRAPLRRPVPVKRPVGGPARHYTKAQVQKIIKDVKAVGQDTMKRADKHQSAVSANVKRITSGVANLRRTLGSKVTAIHGACSENEMQAIIGVCTVFGDDVTYSSFTPASGGSATPMTGYPTDPATGLPIDPATGYPIDPNSGYSSMPTGTAPVGDPSAGAPDYGLGDAPTADSVKLQPGVDYIPDPGMESDANRYNALPLGGVIYDGSTASKNNHGMIGSRNLFSEYGGGGDGYFFGDHGWQKRRGGDWDDLDPQWQSMNPDTLAAIQTDSIKQGWGPLVGNPSKRNSPEADTGRPWMQGLRYNEADGSFFWYRDKAPGWATLNDDQVRLSQAITDYKAAVSAAAAEAAANAAQAILDQQQADALTKQQAAEDAAQQHQITQDQAQAQSEADIQAKADDIAARQQQSADESSIRQAQAQAEIDRAAQQQAFDQQVSLVQQGILPPEALLSQGGGGDDGGEGGPMVDEEGFPVGDQYDAEGFPIGPTYNPLGDDNSEYSPTMLQGHPLYMRPLDQR
jgi:hypothetical protein